MKKKIAALLLAVLVLSTLCACGDDNAELVGSWEYTLDMAPYLNEGIVEGAGDDKLMAEHLVFDSIEIIIVAEYTEADTYYMYVSEDSAAAANEELLRQYKEGLHDYFEALLIAEGVVFTEDYTVDDAIEAAEIDLDAIVAESFPQETLDGMYDGFTQEGQFTAKDGKLYTSAGLSYSIDPKVYESYTIEGDVLTITEGSGGDSDGSFYPMEFVRAE